MKRGQRNEKVQRCERRFGEMKRLEKIWCTSEIGENKRLEKIWRSVITVTELTVAERDAPAHSRRAHSHREGRSCSQCSGHDSSPPRSSSSSFPQLIDA